MSTSSPPPWNFGEPEVAFDNPDYRFDGSLYVPPSPVGGATVDPRFVDAQGRQ
jgi:hypothetical protein